MSRRKRHTPGQIDAGLREPDARLNAGQSLAQGIQLLRISEASFHRRRNHDGGRKAGAETRPVPAGVALARLPYAHLSSPSWASLPRKSPMLLTLRTPARAPPRATPPPSSQTR